jgi:uncharacterized membrane protein
VVVAGSAAAVAAAASAAAAGGDAHGGRHTVKGRIGRGAWMIPAAYSVAAIVIGIMLPRLEHHFPHEFVSGINSASAIAIYSAVGTGTMTLSAIVFSLTFVMVQFSATAYSPRLVLWLAEDPVISHALGIFTGAYLYSISAIAWVDRNDVEGVSILGAIVAVLWLIAAVAAFIALIKRIAVLQVNRMLTFTGDQGRKTIAALYGSDQRPNSEEAAQASFSGMPTHIVAHHGRPRAVQAIDAGMLLELARRADARIEVAVAVGDTVMESTPLLRVYGASILERQLVAAIRVGEQRTFEQDPQYAIRLLVDIAIRALSPAINDPTTAVQALDQIGDLVLRLGRRRLITAPLRDQAGAVRVIIRLPSWDDFLQLAFDEICAYGAASVQVMRRMNALLSELIRALPNARRPALARWQRRIESSINRHFADTDERRAALVEDRQGLGVSNRSAA